MQHEWSLLFASNVALMQVAFIDHVFLIDVINLASILEEKEWKQLAAAIFCNESNVTLGEAVSPSPHSFQAFCFF